MGKLVNLNINGKKVVLGGPGKMALALIAAVRKLKKGEYVTVEGLVERTGAKGSAIQALIGRHKELFDKNRLSITTPEASKLMVYGSEASIAALKKELEA